MTSIRRIRIMASSIATACLILGLAIYVFFRPTTLLMFHWADALGMAQSVEVMRASMSAFKTLLPAWFVFSLPFALWVLAYLFFIESIWASSQSRAGFIWFWCIPLIAICAELAQIKHIIPGRFDWVDVTAIIIAISICFFTKNISNREKGLIKT